MCPARFDKGAHNRKIKGNKKSPKRYNLAVTSNVHKRPIQTAEAWRADVRECQNPTMHPCMSNAMAYVTPSVSQGISLFGAAGVVAPVLRPFTEWNHGTGEPILSNYAISVQRVTVFRQIAL
ncbi:hypothetical protein NDU88_002465 [Pleurodeles waltl]|uniref:Uncharacterized protein n=1 Tax=Pleurodeles waltl TaxID=8319 RepID=A0AAV7P946_PLEWA|nr:hypothetical protein NDU88_002465 [Pleurodeles waltl]